MPASASAAEWRYHRLTCWPGSPATPDNNNLEEHYETVRQQLRTEPAPGDHVHRREGHRGYRECDDRHDEGRAPERAIPRQESVWPGARARAGRREGAVRDARDMQLSRGTVFGTEPDGRG